VPQKVFGDLASKMTEKAYEIFRAGTESPELYHHANDTWNGVKHAQYSTALRELLEEWITANGGRIDEDAAKHFYSWIATGKTKNNKLLALLAKHKKAVATALKWREGFNLSIVIAAAAKEYDPRLTRSDLKKIAQQIINGEANGLSRRAAAAAGALIKGGKKALMATAKRVLPGLMFLSAATAAKRGWSGEGHTGNGAWGAANEVARDAIVADLVEKIVFPKVLDTVDGVVDVLVPALNDPTRYHRVWRNGHWYRTDTWERIE